MEEVFNDDYKDYSQYLRCKDTVRQWWVQWSGPSKEHKHWFYYKPHARKHYNDVTRAGFKATTNVPL